MAIASITQWLLSKDRNYLQGRLLYEQYGDNRVTMALIKSGTGSYHASKLLEGLEKVNQKADLVPKPIIIGDYVPAPTISQDKSSPEFIDAPDKIKDIRQAKTDRYAQARKLHESVRWMDSQENRLKAALEILDHMDFVNEAWSIIDEWKDAGTIREMKQAEADKAVAALTLQELLKESKNLPTYITKDKNNLAAAKTPTLQAKVAARLQLRQHRLGQIKKRLDNELV